MPSTVDSSACKNSLTELTPHEVRYYLNAYSDAIRAKSERSSGAVGSKGKKDGESLVSLDMWYQSLPHDGVTGCSDGTPPTLSTKNDLVRLMRWKLAREKFRPTLMSLIESNTDTLVQEVLHRARKSLVLLDQMDVSETRDVVVRTMKILTELRGVGPATASAITALWQPFGIFQSDELATLLLPRSSIKYDWKFYSSFYSLALQTLHALQASRPLSNEGPVLSGKTLETLAWSIIHSPQPKENPLPSRQLIKNKDGTQRAPMVEESSSAAKSKKSPQELSLPSGNRRSSKRLKIDPDSQT